MKQSRYAFAAILIIVSILNIPKPDILSLVLDITTQPESASEYPEIDSEDPLLKEIGRELDKLADSFSFKALNWSITIAMFFVSIGGIYTSVGVFSGKPIPIVLMIWLCVVSLYAGGAPWDLAYLFEEVNSIGTFMRKINFLWGLHPMRYSLIKDCLFGSFYLITGVIFCVYLLNQKVKKTLTSNSC